jgi:hypothetical protein
MFVIEDRFLLREVGTEFQMRFRLILAFQVLSKVLKLLTLPLPESECLVFMKCYT